MHSSTQSPDPAFEYCDLVMKGGITSGVVYPLAITELSRKYLFKNIGGTSAGAVAAVITAAAEYGRRTGNAKAYDELEQLPKELGTDNLLLSLFQPSTAAARIFRVVLAALKAQSATGRLVRTIASLIRQFWGWTIAGVLLGAAIPFILFFIYSGPVPVYAVLGVFWVVIITGVVLLVAATVDALKVTVRNGFGFCSGFDPRSTSGPPLTNWLHGKIQAAAGKDVAVPLTFGDLWSAPAMVSEPPMTGPTIKLQVVTTNLTLGRPFTIPFEAYAYYFDEDQFRNLFPDSVVQYMIASSPKKPNEIITSRSGKPLHRLPESEKLPVLVAARMSLSFPVLLSAIPLYLPDHAHKVLLGEQEPSDVQESKPPVSVKADLCWFSDGGICSNFPIHFFDTPLPRWPTFGIDLDPQSGEGCGAPRQNDQLVWFPAKPGSGSQLPIVNFDQGSNFERLYGFIGAIVNTMQNWRDRLQATAAGYRDRIVHIKLCPDEGGLNLNMPAKVIEDLSERGKMAGTLINEHFDFPSHMYARFRITMCALQKYMNDLANAWKQPLPQDTVGQKYIRGEEEPPHYRPRSENLRRLLLEILERLVDLPSSWQARLYKEQSFCKDGAPRPEPVLRNQPKF